jgi:hypothetical protein
MGIREPFASGNDQSETTTVDQTPRNAFIIIAFSDHFFPTFFF